MFNDLLLLLIAIPLCFIAIVLAGISVILFVGRRARIIEEKKPMSPEDIGHPAPPAAPELPAPAAVGPEPTLNAEAVQVALAQLADSLNTTMATMQTHAHALHEMRATHLPVFYAAVNAFEGNVTRIDAEIRDLKAVVQVPLPTKKTYGSVAEYLGQLPKKNPAAGDVLPDPHDPDVDPPDVEFDAAGNMTHIPRPDPAPKPVMPVKPRAPRKKK